MGLHACGFATAFVILPDEFQLLLIPQIVGDRVRQASAFGFLKTGKDGGLP
jgi:hypothetical protein